MTEPTPNPPISGQPSDPISLTIDMQPEEGSVNPPPSPRTGTTPRSEASISIRGGNMDSSVVADDIPNAVGGDDTDNATDVTGDNDDHTGPYTTLDRGILPTDRNTDWFNQVEYILFSNELKNIKRSNILILRECKDANRLLDLKFADLTDVINRIQTSVIFLSTLSGFFNATKLQFGLEENIISVMSISISTYVSLILSVSKYYKFDESKEAIQALRVKYSGLHNQIEHRMDVLGPWNDRQLWCFADPLKKLEEWGGGEEGDGS